MANAYLRTCGIGGKLQARVYECAMNGEPVPKPQMWGPRNALQHIHYAAMHMLFLGHAKSNYDMVNKVQVHWKIAASVGKQANIYLRDIQSLRCNRFFDAQPLSTSTWGTGVWVSENYLFWVRCMNFFGLYPQLQQMRTGTRKSTRKTSA